MNILFLVHVENSFRKLFPDKLYVNRLIRSCQAKKYDKVIALVSGIEDYNPIEEIEDYVCNWDWGWGYEPEQFDDEKEKEWVIPALGHEWTWVPPELRIKQVWDKTNIFVGGGYESECLQDWLDVLDHQELPYKKISGLIY